MPGARPNDLVDRAYQVGVAAVVAPAAPADLPDRRRLIRAFGIIQIALGGLLALGLLTVELVILYSRSAPVVGTALAYGIPAANLLTTGIGSVTFARWAWRANVVSVGIWLGVTGTAAVAVPVAHVGGNGYERFMMEIIVCAALAFALTLAVVYARPSVRGTFARRRAG